MCGIIGHIHRHQPIDLDTFNEMRDTLRHRGPDGAGTELLSEERVALGHRRLSIIDLSEHGKQPMHNEDGTVWLTFNGEIYNYAPLRETLRQAGHRFTSHTDSEVLIHGYEEWGIEGLLSRLKGMFAFALWDDRQQELVAARDRFGIKPFVYYLDDEQLVFASEVKAIVKNSSLRKELDPSALADFFIYSYVPHPKSIWQHVRKLPPAHYLRYRPREHALTLQRYWHLPVGRGRMADRAAVERADDLIRRAVNDHLVSDVPVGLFLSGGYDSSTLLMHMTQAERSVSTFSLGFADSPRSEHHQAAAIARSFHSDHHEQIIKKNTDARATLRQMAYYYDEPYATSAMLPYYYVSELAARNNKVALAGDGGDEAFAGYNWHYRIHDYYQHLGLKSRLKDWVTGGKERIINQYYKSMTGVMYDVLHQPVINDELTNRIKQQRLWYYEQFYDARADPVKSFQILDTHTFMVESCLMRADLSSMAHSLEVRVPFLDHEIFEFTFGLDTSVYFKEGVKKHLIYENLKDKVSAEVLNMPKTGFSFQHMGALFDDDYYAMMREGALMKKGILNPTCDLRNVDARLNFHLLLLELWFQEHY